MLDANCKIHLNLKAQSLAPILTTSSSTSLDYLKKHILIQKHIHINSKYTHIYIDLYFIRKISNPRYTNKFWDTLYIIKVNICDSLIRNKT